MPTWEVRRVSGKGFFFDQPVVAYRDLDAAGVNALVAHHQLKHVGGMFDFVAADPSLDAMAADEKRLAAYPTLWQGIRLAPGTLYCIVIDWDGVRQAAGSSGERSPSQLGQDHMVMARPGAFNVRGGALASRRVVPQTNQTVRELWNVRGSGAAVLPPRTLRA